MFQDIPKAYQTLGIFDDRRPSVSHSHTPSPAHGHGHGHSPTNAHEGDKAQTHAHTHTAHTDNSPLAHAHAPAAEPVNEAHASVHHAPTSKKAHVRPLPCSALCFRSCFMIVLCRIYYLVVFLVHKTRTKTAKFIHTRMLIKDRKPSALL